MYRKSLSRLIDQGAPSLVDADGVYALVKGDVFYMKHGDENEPVRHLNVAGLHGSAHEWYWREQERGSQP